MEHKTFYVTTPIYYPNAKPHLGHAYSTLVSDALTRFHKSQKEDVYFLTGTDENTEKVVEAARKVQREPQEYLEEIVRTFKTLYAKLGIEYTQFIRTSDADVHWPGVVEMWKRLEASGDIYKGEYHGWYCIGCETFVLEKDLVDGKCPVHGTEPKRLSEENYFFRLSAYTERLKKIIMEDQLPIVPVTRKQEVVALLEQGLQDISFSRPANEVAWGVPVPGDASQKMYVWMDALTNYISALGFGRGEEYMRFWPGMHVIGKDILRFHAAVWPAMLLSAGLPLPKKLFVHGLIISGGKKMSKSTGNVIDPNDMIARYEAEATRYLLLRHVHPTEDTDVTWERLDEWYTANLTNGLGNLVARVMTLSAANIKEPVEITQETTINPDVGARLAEFEFDKALDAIWERIGHNDTLMSLKKPYHGVKSNEAAEREESLLIIKKLVRELNAIAEELAPFMPKTSKIILTAVRENKKPENLFPRLAPQPAAGSAG